METIKIRSNPYRKEVSFFSLREDNQWCEIKSDNGDSKLREEGTEKMFLPFRIKEIIDIIRREYFIPGGEKVTVVFEGTEDEFEEVTAVCSDEDVTDEINLIRSPEYLDDARDILKHTKEIFLDVQPILDSIIDNDVDVKKNLKKVSDTLEDIIPICIFGNYSAGKSTFINSLIGNEILPSGGDPVTAKIYKLSSSSQEDRIIIKFSYKDEEFELRFDNNGYKVIQGSSNNDLIEAINASIDSFETKELFMMASATLDIVNSFEGKDKNEVVISDIVSIEVPFSKNGVLGQSKNQFVIFDTPGSNSNSNRDHADVLQKAMEEFSNGIPVWVSQYDSIDSIDNANLCDSIYAIEALDKRFTMIVVNKADTAELPENGWSDEDEKKFREFDAIEKMYSCGIYFVSSVMGLGAKNNAKFISKFLRKTFKEKKESFSDPEEKEFYQTLYKYNIMPTQIKKNAITYSLKNENLIYANSGLLCVEKEIETFASKYSSYNKCQMVYSFLNSIIDKSNEQIEKEKAMLNRYKEQEQSALDDKQAKLKDRITRDAQRMKDEFNQESKGFVKTYVKENLQFNRSVADLDTLDGQYTKDNRQKRNLSAYEKDFEESSNKKWSNLWKNIQGLTKGNAKLKDLNEKFKALNAKLKDLRNTYIADEEEMKAKKKSLDSTKREVDKATSDMLIHDIREEYRKNMLAAKEMLDDKIKEHWLENAEHLKKQLASIITESEALTLEKRNEISSLIINYETLVFDDKADDIFIKTRFRRNRASEKLNNKKLADSYNKKISKEIDELAKHRNEQCKGSFYLWEQKLRAVIDQNITEYNPELRQIAQQIATLSEKIRKLEKDQQKIQTSFETIGNMMAWKSFE